MTHITAPCQAPTMGACSQLRGELETAATRGTMRKNLARLARSEPGSLHALSSDWRLWARGDQVPPRGDWRTWVVLGGRGSGKTRTGAEWVRARALGLWPATGAPSRRIALIGPTMDEARAVMVEGVSGLLAVHDDATRPVFESSRRLVTWGNGAVAQLFSAEEPDSLRGFQFDAAWLDEAAKWPRGEEVFDMLQFALRLGDAPRCVVTTTPRPIPLIKRLMADPASRIQRSRTRDNARHLAPGFLTEVERRYGGTRLGRQELDAELIADDPEALFRRDHIEAHRVRAAPELRRVVVAVDPPAGIKGSACGIVCAGLGFDGRGYVLEDCSVGGKSPSAWAQRVVSLYHERGADRIVAEVNQGGAMVETVLREIDSTVAYRAVHATRGKRLRAEPVAALYEQGRVSHVGALPELEDEMCAAAGADRLDALVWALSDLMLRRQAEPRIRLL